MLLENGLVEIKSGHWRKFVRWVKERERKRRTYFSLSTEISCRKENKAKTTNIIWAVLSLPSLFYSLINATKCQDLYFYFKNS